MAAARARLRAIDYGRGWLSERAEESVEPRQVLSRLREVESLRLSTEPPMRGQSGLLRGRR
eukprot:3061435-Pyramimonas_sp.AAC.1